MINQELTFLYAERVFKKKNFKSGDNKIRAKSNRKKGIAKSIIYKLKDEL